MMTSSKNFTRAACLAASLALLVSTGARAETAATPTAEKPAATAVSADKTSDADKRAKAADCSKQADAKKLHGEARKTFREACKKK